MERSITLTGMSRPELFRQTLEGLAANDLAGWHVHIRIEPSPVAAAFGEIARALLPESGYTLNVNATRLGIARNPYEAIEAAFASGSALNLHLEEDFLIASDATAMAAWYARNHRPHWLCLSLLAGPCGSSSLLSNPGFPDALVETSVFNSIGFAVRREEWQAHMRGAWPVKPVPPAIGVRGWRSAWGWDWAVYGMLNRTPHLRTVQPVLARAVHNGPLGSNAKPEFHHRTFDGMPLHGHARADYRLVAAGDLPFEVRSHLQAFDEHSRAMCTAERLDRRLHRPVPALLARRALYHARRLRLRFRHLRDGGVERPREG